MRKTLYYILHVIVVSALLLGMSGCMKNGDIDFPKDQPDPITPTNPNGKRLEKSNFKIAEPVEVPETIDIESGKQTFKQMETAQDGQSPQ